MWGLENHAASQKECEAFVNELKSGAIILLHGNNVPKYTLDFLQKIIPLLYRQDSKFLTVSQLLEKGTPNVVQDG